jgi:hypothetical protein
VTTPLARHAPYTRPRDALTRAFAAALVTARGNTPRREPARRLDVDPTVLLDVEHGRCNLTLDAVERYAAAYGLAVTLQITPGSDAA